MKIDVSRIIVNHHRTLRDYSTGRYSLADVFIFYGLPSLATAICMYFTLTLSADVLNAFLTAFSIFAGLLLNLLILVLTFPTRALAVPTNKARDQLVRELHDNLAYSILLAIVLVVVVTIAMMIVKGRESAKATHTAGRICTGIIVLLSSNFLLTLLMILKRIYIIMTDQLGKPRPQVSDIKAVR